jgi:hypothetical protein
LPHHDPSHPRRRSHPTSPVGCRGGSSFQGCGTLALGSFGVVRVYRVLPGPFECPLRVKNGHGRHLQHGSLGLFTTEVFFYLRHSPFHARALPLTSLRSLESPLRSHHRCFAFAASKIPGAHPPSHFSLAGGVTRNTDFSLSFLLNHRPRVLSFHFRR